MPKGNAQVHMTTTLCSAYFCRPEPATELVVAAETGAVCVVCNSREESGSRTNKDKGSTLELSPPADRKMDAGEKLTGQSRPKVSKQLAHGREGSFFIVMLAHTASMRCVHSLLSVCV